jgi:hypothetical protein
MRLREASDYLNERIPEGRKIAIISVQSESAALSEYIIDELISNAVNDNRYSVVDRQQLDAARAELHFNMSGEVSDQSAQTVGQFIGAQVIITGRVSRIGDLYRFNIRALEVESVQVQGSRNIDIAAGGRINALMAASSGSATAGGLAWGTAAAPAGGAESGQTAQAATQESTRPAAPANGTYTLWPRPRATQGGIPINTYIDQIVIGGGYMTVFVTGTSAGRGALANAYSWYVEGNSLIQDLDNPRLAYNGIDAAYGENHCVTVVFQNVTSRRFSLTNSGRTPPMVFEEIIIPDKPD